MVKAKRPAKGKKETKSEANVSGKTGGMFSAKQLKAMIADSKQRTSWMDDREGYGR